VASGPVENQHDLIVGVRFTEFSQEGLEAVPIHVGHFQAEAFSSGRFDSGIQSKPFVLLLAGPWRAMPPWAPPSPIPSFRPEARLVYRKHANRLPSVFGPGRLLHGLVLDFLHLDLLQGRTELIF
jgi:hypothetical protein